MAGRTLVVHTGGIGDFLLACPSIARLSEDGPVELAGRPERLELAIVAGIAVAAHDLDAIAYDSIFATPKPTLIDFVRRFDRVVVWMRDPGGRIASQLTQFGVPDVRVFPGLPPDSWERHASCYYAECLGVTLPEVWQLKLQPTSNHLDVVIHPGSGGVRKNWPIENFIHVADALTAAGRRVSWTRGPAEEEQHWPETCSWIAETSLIELGRRIAGSRLYIGNDSGITHLAASVGCPTVVVFGPTDPVVWGPRGNHVAIVRGAPWPETNAVLDAVAKLETGGGPVTRVP